MAVYYDKMSLILQECYKTPKYPLFNTHILALINQQTLVYQRFFVFKNRYTIEKLK